MNILKPVITEAGGTIRIASQIITGRGAQHTLWAELDKQYASFVADDCTAVASPFVLPASRHHEQVSIAGSVSHQWAQGVSEIIDRVVGWNTGFTDIAVHPAELHEDVDNRSHTKNVGVFFSGGVDSFTTFLKYQKENKQKISHLIFVHGFDIELANIEQFKQVLDCVQRISAKTGVPLITVRTNVREITDGMLGWEMAHGGALAMVALLLRKGFDKIIIPGGGLTDWQEPWGSSEYLDPRWSTESMQIIHEEETLMRFEKVRDYIAKSDLALKNLRVCWRNNGYNCCECDKCMMTMAELRIAGVADKMYTFPKGLNLQKLSNMFTTQYSIQQYVQQALEYLQRTHSDQDLEAALEASLEISYHPSLKRRLITLIHDLDWKYNESRFFVWLQKRARQSRYRAWQSDHSSSTNSAMA